MAFEYNGFIHRDLEPQVRYDAEQVQLLKQADVTINESLHTVNESLQTVNTELNGKLTKPTNPSAESAVTMLADGTVGTKPLSEIGGGGKLYRHNVNISYNDDGIHVYLVFYTTNQTLINTIDKIKANSNDDYVDCVYSGFDGGGSVYFQVNNATTFNLWGAIVARGNPSVVSKGEFAITPTRITDTVTQL